MSRPQRKSSSHKTILVHFHDDGSVCPASFGQTCPYGGVEGHPEPVSPTFLQKLPNGFQMPNFSGFNFGPPGQGGGQQSGQGNGFDIGGGNDFNAFSTDFSTNSTGLTSSTSNNFDTSGFMSDLSASLDLNSSDFNVDVAPNSLAIPEGNAQNNQNIAQMAKMAVSSGSPSAVAAMAKMAAATGNAVAAKAMVQMAQMAAKNGVKSIPPEAIMQVMGKTGLGGTAGLNAAMSAARQTKSKDNPEKQVEAQKYQAVVMKQAANVQISKTISNSSLATMSDQQVKKMTGGNFKTNKEFMDFMQSSDTDVKKKQEQLLKVRNFLPPQSQEPEIFLLEKLVNQAAEADQRLESVAKAQGQTSDGFLPRLDPSLSGNFDADTPEKLKLQEELFRLRSHRKDGEAKKEHLLNRAKVLQARAASHKAKLAGLWEEKLKEEQTKTGPLEEVCAALREALDAEHKKRMEAFENKMKPIIIKDGPSKKANYKINAAKLYYEIYSLSQRLRLTTIRVEHEEEKRERAEREVRRLREEISVKKTAVTTATKGIPVNKIEVRPQEQQPNFSGPTAAINPMLVGLSNEAQLILATSSLGGAASPVKQLLEANAARGLASIEMDRELQEAFGTPPQPPSRNQQTPQGLTPLPRSAKITMDEAAEAAVDLAKPANSNYGGKMPNGRPPAIETGTN